MHAATRLKCCVHVPQLLLYWAFFAPHCSDRPECLHALCKMSVQHCRTTRAIVEACIQIPIIILRDMFG